ncbi:MAG: glycosyltransferase family 4 protein [Limisphaerales bacterium]
MKIGFSTSVIQRGKTGIAQYVFALLRAFATEAKDDHFVLFVLEKDQEFFRDLDDRFEIVLVPEKYRPPVENIVWHQTLLPKIAQKLELDVLHVPSYRRLMWRRPCPLVATIHDLAPFRVSRKYDLARMFYGRVVVKHLAHRQNEIITVSHNTAVDIEQFFKISRHSVRVIHNGIEHDRFFPRPVEEARAAVAQKYRLNKPFFLYVARLEHPGKNHRRLIEAFERFKEETGSEWILAFGGSDWHGAELIHARIAESSYGSDVRTLGFISNDDLPLLYSAAEAFVYPSLYEGFGLPPLEAMACACPVISSDRGSLGEVVGEAAWIVEPEDVEDICDALIKLHSEPKSRAALVQKGLARSKDFSWERAARETLAVYRMAYQKSSKCASGTGLHSLSSASAARD